MSNDNIIRLVIRSAFDGSGFDDAVTRTNQLMGGTGALSQAVKNLGSAFGGAGSALGQFASLLAKGSIWGVAASGVGLIVEKVKEWHAAAQAAARRQAEMTEEIRKGMTEAAEATKNAYSRASAAIDEQSKKKQADIELTKNQMKAELELAAAKAKASGKVTEAIKLEAQAREAERKATEESAAAAVAAAKAKVAAAKKTASGLPGRDRNGNFEYDPYYWEDQRRLRNGRQMRLKRELDAINARQTSVTAEGIALGGMGGGKATISVADAERKKKIEEELKLEDESRKRFFQTAAKAKQAAQNIKEANKALDDATKREDIAKKKVEKQRVEERAAEAQAARESEVKRLRDMIASNNAKAAALGAGSGGGKNSWQSRFDSAFELWRDPAAAQAARDQAVKRDEDMKAFRRAVRKQSGLGYANIAAEYMRNGDEEGLQEQLSKWRRNSRFDARTEQAVLAAAAEQNKGQAERDIAEIAKNTRDLSKKIDDLLKVK